MKRIFSAIKKSKPVFLFISVLLLGHPATAQLSPSVSDVFTGNHEGYTIYRIPAIITTVKGTVLAFCEGRNNLRDQSENDIVMKRSPDGGKTWDSLCVVEENGKHSLNNPTVLQDTETGKIFLMYQDYPFIAGERGVKPGYKGDHICRTFITFSTDEGIHWSSPREITRSVKRRKIVTSTASGPGVGIRITHGKYRGRLVVPFNQGPWGQWKVYTVYSDNHGKTWKRGNVAPEGSKGHGNEVQVAEMADGRLLLNARSFNGNHCRKKAISNDGGETWSPLTDDPALPEPQCQGTMIRFSFPDNGQKSRLIFANPASQSKRIKGTVRISYDEGKTWPISKLIYPGSFAYSCLTRIDSETVGLLFERDNYKKISFVRLPLDWLEKQIPFTVKIYKTK